MRRRMAAPERGCRSRGRWGPGPWGWMWGLWVEDAVESVAVWHLGLSPGRGRGDDFLRLLVRRRMSGGKLPVRKMRAKIKILLGCLICGSFVFYSLFS